MATKRVDDEIARSNDIVDVRLVRACGGGWHVIATLGDRILAIRHCDDWHRAERAFCAMSSEAQLRRGEAA